MSVVLYVAVRKAILPHILMNEKTLWWAILQSGVYNMAWLVRAGEYCVTHHLPRVFVLSLLKGSQIEIFSFSLSIFQVTVRTRIVRVAACATLRPELASATSVGGVPSARAATQPFTSASRTAPSTGTTLWSWENASVTTTGLAGNAISVSTLFIYKNLMGNNQIFIGQT